jgi:hypothetical protein
VIDRAFDGVDAHLTFELINAALASADQNLARKEAEAAALAEKTAADELAKRAAAKPLAAPYLTPSERRERKKADLLIAPRAIDLSLNSATFASDGGSSTDGLPVKNPYLVDGSLSYAPMAESALLGESVGTASVNLTSPTCGALRATDLSLNSATFASDGGSSTDGLPVKNPYLVDGSLSYAPMAESAPMGGSPGYVNDAIPRIHFTRSRSSVGGGGRRSLGGSYRSLCGL